MYVYVVHMYVYMHVCMNVYVCEYGYMHVCVCICSAYVCVCMWSHETEVGHILACSFALLTETGVLNQTQSSLVEPVLLDSLLSASLLCQPRLEL